VKAVKPAYLIALGIVAALALLLHFSNPYKKYSTSGYWKDATLEDVAALPEQALLPGNRNGSVLMWAAVDSDRPEIIRALIDRGADVAERDPIFTGTVLTAAAAYSANPDVITELVRQGAELEAKVLMGDTALIIAARENRNPGITARLLELGADPKYRNKWGDNALDTARDEENEVAEQELMAAVRK